VEPSHAAFKDRSCRALLIAGAFFTISHARRPGAAGSSSQEVRALNGEALRLQSESRRQKSQAVDLRAAKSLERRQKALRQLMERDPAAAAAIALPTRCCSSSARPSRRRPRISSSAAAGRRNRIPDRGRPQSQGPSRDLQAAPRGETLDVKFAGREPPRMKSGQKLRLKGVRSMRTVAATEAEVLDAFMGTGAARSHRMPMPRCARRPARSQFLPCL